MTSFASLCRASAAPCRQLLLAAAAAAVSMGALSATATASTRPEPRRIRYDGSVSDPSGSVDRALLAPRRLRVVGHRLEWAPVRGVSQYIFRHRQDGQPKVLRVLATTSVHLVPVPNATVHYSVRTDMPGSVWASPITIVYSESGGVLEVRGETPGSGSGSGSGSGESGGGGEKTRSPELKVGLIGGVVGWGATTSETIRNATGVRYTRLSPSVEGWVPAEEMVADGITPYLLYNPETPLADMSPAQVAEGVESYVPHMQELGLKEIELGNEVYYHGSSASTYAADYRAAREALKGTGITLIADAWTDAPKPNGEWSQWESGGGWCVLFVEALGYVPDAWSFHPYGPMNADGFGSGADRPGWGTVPRMISYMKADHVYAPLDITEVGQPTYQGSDGNTPVSEAEQAQDVKQYIDQAGQWGLTGLYLYDGIDTGEGGYGLYKWPLQAKPSAAAFAAARAEVEGNAASALAPALGAGAALSG